ncbi:acid phosphatase [Acetobacteraceae bacterium]|nr:acid phosphatase [Acetobacteraceae bacterium]
MSENILKRIKKNGFSRAFYLSLAVVSFCSIGSAFANTVAQDVPLQNISDLSAALVRYHDNGQYQRDFDRVANQAIKYLQKEANPSKHQAIVLDIDETTLSQWPALKANQFAYFKRGATCHLPKGPCPETGWVRKEAATAFPSTRSLIEEAQKNHVAVFFITGRSVKYRHHMIRNLHKEKINNWTGLYMRDIGDKRSASDYKTPIRKQIEGQGYQIILNMGDQKTDLAGGHGGKTFLLPNPFYKVG